MAKYLLDEGAQLEAKDEWQGRALHMAALYGHDKVVDLLVERGADVRGPLFCSLCVHGQASQVEKAGRKGNTLRAKTCPLMSHPSSLRVVV